MPNPGQLEDLGVSLRKGRLVGARPIGAGIEVCTVYASPADASAAAAHIDGLIKMVTLAGGEGAGRIVH